MRSSNGPSKGFSGIRLAAKLLLGALPFVVFYCYARFYADGYMDGEWAMYKQVRSYVRRSGLHNDFLIMGDSTAKFNINAAALSSEDCAVQNIALGGSTPVECYYTLKRYLDNGNTVDTVIAAWTPNNENLLGALFSRTEYFHALDLGDLVKIYLSAVPYSDNGYIHNSFFNEPIFLMAPIKAWLRWPSKYLPSVNNARFRLRYKANKDATDFYEKSKGSHFCGDRIHATVSRYANQKRFVPLDFSADYLSKVLELCRQHQITFIIEQTPMTMASQGRISETFETDYFAYLHSFKDRYTNVSCPSSFTYFDDKYFVDDAHMNNAGNAAYTQYIKETYIDPYIARKNGGSL